MQETHVFSSSLVNVATLGYAGTWGSLVNAPAVPIPSSLAFLPPGNPGTLVIGGGIGAAAPSAVAGVPGNNPTIGTRHYFTESDDLHWTKGKHSWSFGGWIQRIQQSGESELRFECAADLHVVVIAHYSYGEWCAATPDICKDPDYYGWPPIPRSG